MTESMKKFLETVSKDTALAEKISKLDKAELIAAAKELGFDLTDEDLVPPEQELDQLELESCVGGGRICACSLAGGGKGEGDLPPCACVAAGIGRDGGNGVTCVCPAAGYGGWWTLGTQ